MEQKLNVLWLYGEDISPWMGCYGDHTVETPHIDALAREGAIFLNCYSVSPVCSPVRSGIITGCMPTTIGVHQHVSSRAGEPPIELPPHVATLPELFKAQGYYTYNHGKDDYNFVYKREDLYEGGGTGEPGSPFAGDWSERAPGQPFFGQIMLMGGKNKKKPDTEVDPEQVQVAPYYPQSEEFKQQYATHYNQIKVTDQEVGGIIQRLKEEGLYESTLIFFISDHGYQLLRHKQFLYDGGIHVPLIIAAPGRPDLVQPGLVRDNLVSSLDIAATTLALAGLEAPAWMESRNMFAPDYRRDHVISARDRCGFAIDRIRSVRTKSYKYIRNFLTDRPLMQPQYRDHTVWYKQWMEWRQEGRLTPVQAQFVCDERPAEELYDLSQDPHETVNLADNPEYAGVLAEMRTILDRWIGQTDDKGQYPEPDEQLAALLQRHGERCVNPEYDRVRVKQQ